MWKSIAAVAVLFAAVQPAFAASLDLTSQPTAGVAGKAYFQLPFGTRSAEAPHAGFKMAVARQDRDAIGFAQGARREADMVDLRLTLGGERSLALAGVPVTGPGALAAAEDGKKHFPWGTVALVAGGLLVAGAATFAYIVHEAEKNSD